MPEIQILDGTVEVEASLLGRGLGLDPSQIPDLLRSGAITSRCERGIGEDEGRLRLTFFHAGRRLRLVVDADGRVLQRSTIDFGDRPLPGTLHRPGG